jgi:ADP-ribose pyrophosphatase
MDISSYAVQDSVVEYENKWYTAGYDRVKQPDGSEKNYYWVGLSDAVVIVAITPDEEIVMVEQYRPAAEELFCGCPTGMVDSGESYTEAAVRELREETGFVPDDTTFVTEVAVATGVLRHTRGVVIATGVTDIEEQDLDGNELLNVHTLPVPESIEALWEEPVDDATITGVLAARKQGFI